MLYATIIISSVVIAWGIGLCGKNIGVGLIEISKKLQKNEKK